MTSIYNFHPVTRELLGTGIADESPLEPGVPLVPANATTLKPPPIGDRQVAIFQGGAWAATADYRGVTYWLDGVPVLIEEIGISPPAESTPEPLPPTLPALKAALIAGVDDMIGSIYYRFTRFETEYLQREAAARTFRAAGYTGDAGVWVTAFASNAGISAAQGSDVIISQADTLRAALVQLGALRMRKYSIAAAATAEAAQAVHDEITDQAAAIAATL